MKNQWNDIKQTQHIHQVISVLRRTVNKEYWNGTDLKHRSDMFEMSSTGEVRQNMAD